MGTRVFHSNSRFDREFVKFASANPEIKAALVPIVKEAKKWKTLPKGWTDKSVKKFWDSLTGEVKHKVTKCLKKMKDSDITDPGAFCGSLADKMEPGWRSRKAAGKGRYVETRDLPAPILKALKGVGYGRRQIEVKPDTTFTMSGVSGQGSRAFTIAVNLSTGRYQVPRARPRW